MVKSNITSLSGSGLKDWFLQRVSAVCIALYVLALFIFLVTHAPLSYSHWHGFMHTTFMRIFNVLFVFALCVHAWIGAWTATTDYLKCTCMRVSAQIFFRVILLVSLLWSMVIFWGG